MLERRLAFDRDPEAFCADWADAQRVRGRGAGRGQGESHRACGSIGRCCNTWPTRVAEHDVRSLRADLAVVRASRAHAALDGSDAVSEAHVEAVLPLALAHRMHLRHDGRPTQPPSPERPAEPSRRGDESASGDSALERVFEAASIEAPRLTVDHSGGRAGQASR